ncbi:family 16 glycosylhydrolase [Flavobacterium granuli]|uniref:Beta-glucanase (GH16 family) n=1 Tax=Flavobacterium granuli TaxID=280093 RepID=A0ABU1S5F5_9FLAO|nr:family 16 glycosylhydrolase [Flavobacterium granuli]MDR6846256.1 beta-glucanase (GH16 family) [Flavobacterium granuli]
MEIFKKIMALPMLLFLALLSCSSGESKDEPIVENTESKLVINAEVVGTTSQLPNGDGSGVVNFKINSNSGTSYKVIFGDGQTLETTTGVFTYTYTSSGTKTFDINVTAFNGLKYLNSTKSIVVFVASKQIWADEFDVDGAPNSEKWSYDLGAGGWGNNEPQYYTKRLENSVVKDGVLKIHTIKENYLGSTYTSARLQTSENFSLKYGKVVFRAKLPAQAGTWPALWMLGSNISTVGWPACGEIDVMEHVGNQLNKIFSTLHHPGHSGGNGDGLTKMISTATSEFHTYTVDWRAETIKFYIDDTLFYTFTNNASLPFNQNFFLIINCAIGGDFGGAIDPNFTSSTFEIDYVRVYN